jgi:HEAT repeat protein
MASERSLPLIREAAKGPRPEIRATAAPLLQRLRADSELLSLLQDPDRDVRESVVITISKVFLPLANSTAHDDEIRARVVESFQHLWFE